MDLTPSTQLSCNSANSGYFVWAPEDERIAVHLHGEAVDQIGTAVMRGFAALRKRGAEVGGLLLGTVERGAKTVVRVEEFVEIPCVHLHGPSYLLCEDDMAVLDQALAEYSADSSAPLRAVGFFRSNTREQMGLSEADFALLNSRFFGVDDICLLVQPFSTRPSEAVLLTRGAGGFPVEARHEAFVFRRRELQLPLAPRRERMAGPSGSMRGQVEEFTAWNAGISREPSLELDSNSMSRRRFHRSPLQPVGTGQSSTGAAPSGRHCRADESQCDEEKILHSPARLAEPQTEIHPAPVERYSWFWLRLSLVFLLVGAFIGVALTLTMNATQTQTANQDPYSLGLSVSQFGDRYQLKWNLDLPAMRHARGGELLIEEGTAGKTQQLSADDLARGGLIYRGAAAQVRFRLTVFLGVHSSLSEAVCTGSGTQP